MILTIGQGWQIDTAVDEKGNPWADLWNVTCRAAYTGPGCIERCLDDFISFMKMNDDQINDWQRETDGI